MDLFLNWAKKNGAWFEKVNVNQSTASSIRGRTLRTNEAIKAGEAVLFIPENMLMSDWRGRRTRLGNLVSKEAVRRGLPGKLEQMLVVSTFLLHESTDPNSFWKPFIDTFPNLRYIPSNFIELCRSELRNTYTLKLIEDEYYRAKLTYEIYSHFGQYSWYEYLQAFLYVNSRSFTNPKVGLKLAPIAGLINHHHPFNADYIYDMKSNGYLIVARADIRRNEEVTFSYGHPTSSGLLFANFGFIIPDAEWSGARIHLSLAHYFPEFDKKKQIMPSLQHSHFSNLEPEYLIDYPKNNARLQIMTVFEHLRIYTQPIRVTTDNELFFDVTLESEQTMLKEFIRVLGAAIDRMKSSLSEDEALLKELKGEGQEADSQMIKLVSLRLEERNVLVSWKNFANQCIIMLRSRTMVETTRFSSYIDRVISPLILGVRVNLS